MIRVVLLNADAQMFFTSEMGKDGEDSACTLHSSAIYIAVPHGQETFFSLFCAFSARLQMDKVVLY